MKLRNLFLLALVGVLLTACGAPATQTGPGEPPAAATLAPVTPEPGKGGLTGQVSGTDAIWPGEEITIFAAPFASTTGGNGYYVLEPNKHPNAPLQKSGTFQLNNMNPGNYVLVVGPEPAGARLVVDNQGKTRIFTVKEGEVQDLGTLELAK